MTPDRAGTVVIGSLAATAFLAVVNDVRTGTTPKPRIIVGAFVAGIGLTLVSEFAPDPAAALAVVILLGALFGAGGAAAVAAIGGAVGAHPYEQQVTKAHPEFYGTAK